MYLPIELHELIISFIDGNDTFKASTVCKLWFNILNKNFKKDDCSVRSMNDSFTLKRLFAEYGMYTFKYINIDKIYKHNCLNIVTFTIIVNDYFNDDNLEQTQVLKDIFLENIETIHVKRRSNYWLLRVRNLLETLLYRHAYTCNLFKPKYIIKLMQKLICAVSFMEWNSYDSNTIEHILNECMKCKCFTFVLYLLMLGAKQNIWTRLIPIRLIDTPLSDIIEEVQFMIDKKLINLPLFLIDINKKNFPHKNDIIGFVGQYLDDDIKETLHYFI